jgi:hypothetical protein
MSGLFNTVAGILSLRAGPQNLSASWNLTVLLVAVYLLLGIYTGQQLGDENAAATSLAVTTLQYAAVGVMLYLRKHPERLAQTLAALAATGIVLGLLSYVFLAQADPARDQPVLALVWFGIFFWSLVVDGHIYRHALSISMAQGLLVAVLLLAASYVLVELTFR